MYVSTPDVRVAGNCRKDLPPRSTVHDSGSCGSYDGTLDRIHHALYVACREQGEREASPTAAIIDSQSVKAPKKGGQDRITSHGYDAGKRSRAEKKRGAYSRQIRWVCYYTRSFIPPTSRTAMARHPAACHSVSGMYPFLKKLFADGGYQGAESRRRLRILPQLQTEIIKRSDQAKGFVVLPPFGRRAHHCSAQPLPKACKDWKTSIARPWRCLRLASIRLMPKTF